MSAEPLWRLCVSSRERSPTTLHTITDTSNHLQILEAMNLDSEMPLTSLKVDGGMTVNKLLLQLQSDLLGIPVGVSTCQVTSAGCGDWPYPSQSFLK